MMTFWQHGFKSHEAIAQDDDDDDVDVDVDVDDDVDPASCWLIEVHVTSAMVKLHRINAYNGYGVYM
jgi:hypothetical protein